MIFDRLQWGCRRKIDNGSGMMDEYIITASVPWIYILKIHMPI